MSRKDESSLILILSLTRRLHQWMMTINSDTSSHTTPNEICQPNRAHGRADAIRQMFFLAYCKRPAPSGRWLLYDEIINGPFISLSSPAKRRYQRMKSTNSDASSHVKYSEIEKPNRAHGRADAMRQAFFLAYCKRPAQSGRRLSRDKMYNELSILLSRLTTCSAFCIIKQQSTAKCRLNWNNSTAFCLKVCRKGKRTGKLFCKET